MKLQLAAIVLIPLLLPVQVLGGCSDAETNGFDCYRYALRAVRESSLPMVREFANKSKRAAEKALENAEECACYGAEEAFLTAFRYARNAEKAETVEQSKEHLRYVLQSAEAGSEAAEKCK
jgi:hypothetical protein